MNNVCSSRNLPAALFLKAKAPAYRHADAATILWFGTILLEIKALLNSTTSLLPVSNPHCS